MSKSLFNSLSLTTVTVAFAVFAAVTFGQTDDKVKRNNPFAPSPKAKAKQIEPQQLKSVLIEPVASNIKAPDREQAAPPRSIARETFDIARRSTNANAGPTSIYRVGIGDVLTIEIQNAVTSSGYYTVRTDGTIDFPLAGENVLVSGQSIDDIEGALTDAVKLYEKPRIEVKIHEYVSHGVLINGLVDVPGYHQIQRDAVPLYIARANAIVSPRASGVTIKRDKDGKVESFLLANSSADSVLIFPGDSVEFTGSGDSSTVGYYFIGGDVASGGKKDLAAGMTLSQAIMASGGPKGKPKRALIRRRDETGMLVTTEFEIKGINSGKLPDPALNQGDIIELGK